MYCQDLTVKGWFDFIVLVLISANCITLAMERPNIPPWSLERTILDVSNHVFTVAFAIEMGLKVRQWQRPNEKGLRAKAKH